MKTVNINWTGSEDTREGHAVYTCDGAQILSLSFESFVHANAVCKAMNLCINAGYLHGVSEAKSAMLIGMQKLGASR